MASEKKDWVITAEALDRLLAALDPDRDRAAQKYEELRFRLIKLFKWRGCLLFEEFTDQTIDRVARLIEEGGSFRTPNPYTFFYAVANNLLKEHWRKTQREAEMINQLEESQSTSHDPEHIRSENEMREAHDARVACLHSCLDRLSTENLNLIKKYYAEGDMLNKDERKKMAEEFRISVNALRVRAFRIRTQVEECVGTCLSESAG